MIDFARKKYFVDWPKRLADRRPFDPEKVDVTTGRSVDDEDAYDLDEFCDPRDGDSFRMWRTKEGCRFRQKGISHG